MKPASTLTSRRLLLQLAVSSAAGVCFSRLASGSAVAAEAASEATTREAVARDGTKLFIQQSGRGKPIVFLHGWSLNSDIWGEQFAALAVKGGDVANQKLDAMGVGDHQLGLREAADIFFALENQRCLAAIGDDLPGARAGEAGDFADLLDFRNKLAAGQFFFKQLADGWRKIGEAVDPAYLVAFKIDQGDSFIGCRNRKGAHGNDAFVFFAALAG